MSEEKETAKPARKRVRAAGAVTATKSAAAAKSGTAKSATKTAGTRAKASRKTTRANSPITKKIEVRAGTPTPQRRAVSFPELVRRVVLAGTDIAGSAPAEAERLVRDLLNRGDLPKADADWLLGQIRERTQQVTSSARRTMGDSADDLVSLVDERLERLLTRLNIPTRRDIASLNQSIDNLSRRVEQLTRQDQRR